MFEDAKRVIAASSPDTSVYVGCDSVRFKKNGKWFARYATVVIVHYASRHGASIFHQIDVLPEYDYSKKPLKGGNTKTRILQEAIFAGMAAAEIAEVLDGRHLEVHLDINPDPKYKSNIALSEAVGYVLGTTGVKPKIKPHAWAASHASDHCARGKRLH